MTNAANRQGLHDAIREITDPTVVMHRIVAEALVVIPSAKGALVELREGDRLRVACGAGTLATCDAHDDAVRDRICESASVASVPLRWTAGSVGVLTVTSPAPRAFGAATTAMLERLAEFVATLIGLATELGHVTDALLGAGAAPVGAAAEDFAAAPGGGAISEFVANVLRPGLARTQWTRERIADVIETRSIDLVCQPIVDLQGGQTVGFEALSRFPRRLAATPDAWFQQAHAVGLGVELELTAVERALELLEELPPEVFLAINVGPKALLDPQLAAMLAQTRAEAVVLELTEHVRVDDYPGLSEALAEIRPRGPALAIDDTGAGYASLAHIVRLSPDIIKLDRSLTGGIDGDPIRSRLAALIVELARDMGAKVIAEGIGNAAEMSAIRALGVDYGQGYYIGRPAPLATVVAG